MPRLSSIKETKVASGQLRDNGLQLNLSLDPHCALSLQTQLFEQVRELILSGVLKGGVALPPSRHLAHRYRLSRNTVSLAYDRLTTEGYARARGTAGVFVCEVLPEETLLIAGVPQKRPPDLPQGQDAEPVLCFAGSPGGDNDRPAIDFWVGRSDPALFPLRTWRSLINKRLASGPAHFTDYSDPAGLPELREAIADHLAQARGMHVSPDQIIVTNGGQDALNLIYRLVANRTSQLCIENPCYLGASFLFQSTGKKIIAVPVDEDGLRVHELPKTHGNLLYVTPSHQFPTGATLTLKRRIAVLQWAQETDSTIIEDDYDSDFRYDGPPQTALAGLDRSHKVFYMGTFSKSVGAGLRLGFAVLPQEHWNKARMLKAQMSNGQSWLEQAVLADFLAQGHFHRHLRRLQQVYKSRRDCLVNALTETFECPVLSGTAGGLHLTWRLPQNSPPASTVQINARQNGVGVYSLRSGASFDFNSTMRDDTLLFGYSSIQECDIARAVRELHQILERARPARSAVAGE
ncbi:MAG: PLP-dependent aminotransferase family protein [Hyphomicrobium sp.]